MSDSVVGICNIALTSLGANTITSLSDGTAEAVLCDAVWDNARRAVLRMHPWNFALKRIELAAEVGIPVFDYTKSYPLPADALRVIQVFQNPDYRLEGKRIVTNASTCFVKYIYDNQDIGSWDDNFKDLMAARVRMDLAFGITRSNTAVTTANALFVEKLRVAKGIDASEDMTEPFGHFDNSLVEVRF
jgi:hypothetical protein